MLLGYCYISCETYQHCYILHTPSGTDWLSCHTQEKNHSFSPTLRPAILWGHSSWLVQASEVWGVVRAQNFFQDRTIPEGWNLWSYPPSAEAGVEISAPAKTEKMVQMFRVIQAGCKVVHIWPRMPSWYKPMNFFLFRELQTFPMYKSWDNHIRCTYTLLYFLIIIDTYIASRIDRTYNKFLWCSH